MCYEVLIQNKSNTSVDVFDLYCFITLVYRKVMSSYLIGKTDFELCKLFVDRQMRLDVVVVVVVVVVKYEKKDNVIFLIFLNVP